MARTDWQRVKRGRPCPICGRTSWCLVAIDGGAAICPRTHSDKPIKSGSGELVGYLHALGAKGNGTKASDELARVRAENRRRAEEEQSRQDAEALSQPELDELARRCNRELEPEKLQKLADELGVYAASLADLEMGWDAARKAWTFPMVGVERCSWPIIGIRLRDASGRKYAVRGSRNGLFVPRSLPGLLALSGRLVIVEGPTSCAACLDADIAAVGRASCNTGEEHLRDLLDWIVASDIQLARRLELVVVGDHDTAKSRPDGTVFYPGQEGAERIAFELAAHCSARRIARGGIRVVVPPHVKDMRDWRKAVGPCALPPLFDAVCSTANYVNTLRR